MIVSTTSIPKLVSPRAEPPDLSGDLDPIQGAQPPDSSGLRFLGNACSHLSCFCLCGRSGAHGVGREEKSIICLHAGLGLGFAVPIVMNDTQLKSSFVQLVMLFSVLEWLWLL